MVQPAVRTADLNLRASGPTAAHSTLPGGSADFGIPEPPVHLRGPCASEQRSFVSLFPFPTAG
jgi:hypothetical protein